jgi:hypothetical protein
MTKAEDEFCFTFKAKSGRNIIIKIDEPDDFIAYYNGKEIGRFETGEDENGTPLALSINVKAEYRNLGIGGELVRRAYEYKGAPLVPPGPHDRLKTHGNTITEDGMRLVLSAQKKGHISAFSDDE